MTQPQTMHRQVQKRARPQLSCTFCRGGKLKCDRNQPCNQCIKRSRDSQCSYLAPPPKKSKPNRNAKDRIAHLEELVVKLMNQGNDAPETPKSLIVPASVSRHEEQLQSTTPQFQRDEQDEKADGVAAFGQMKISQGGGTSYVGAAHWEAILNGIGELKAYFKDADESETSERPFTGDGEQKMATPEVSQLLLGDSDSIVTREYLIQCIPPKKFSSDMLWMWFTSSNPALATIHKPTFSQEYAVMQEDPSKVPTMWLSMYFGMLAIGCFFYALERPLPEETKIFLTEAIRFQKLAAQALILADYTYPKKYTIEALLMYATAMHLHNDHNHLSLWLVLGTLLRVALKMGYHRDPSHTPALSPFESEMRRRLWLQVHVFDILGSFTVGMPDMIRQVQSDVRCPLNLLDTDFGPSSTTLPPERPWTELSSVTYSIVKTKLAREFARAADLSHSVTPPEYELTQELDSDLDKAYAEVPDPLRFVSMDMSISETPAVIFNRFKLDLLYHKSKCVLHRRYLMTTPTNENESNSQRKCVEAAVKILGHLETVHSASLEGGRLRRTPYLLNAVGSSDFLLAVTVICLALARSSTAPVPGFDTVEAKEKMKSLLEAAYKAYSTPSLFYKAPEKAMRALERMVVRCAPAGLYFTHDKTKTF
jgi:hypothetical protein